MKLLPTIGEIHQLKCLPHKITFFVIDAVIVVKNAPER